MLTQLCTRGQLFKSEGAGIVRVVGIMGTNVELRPFSSLPPLQIKSRQQFPGGFLKKVVAVLSFLFLFLLCLPAALQAQQTIRVNAGGSAYRDSKGQTWSADYGFNTGSLSHSAPWLRSQVPRTPRYSRARE